MQLLINNFSNENRDKMLQYSIDGYFSDMNSWLLKNEKQEAAIEEAKQDSKQSNFANQDY